MFAKIVAGEFINLSWFHVTATVQIGKLKAISEVQREDNQMKLVRRLYLCRETKQTLQDNYIASVGLSVTVKRLVHIDIINHYPSILCLRF